MIIVLEGKYLDRRFLVFYDYNVNILFCELGRERVFIFVKSVIIEEGS